MKRISQLDGVRGIAIILVLLWHYVRCELVDGPQTHFLMTALSLTWSGVDLFFVLSGFLIAGILIDHRNSANYFKVFYLRRVCRIFPLYFLLLGLFVGLSSTPISKIPWFAWLFQSPLPIWSYATFTQNIFMGLRGNFGANGLGVTWSLAVEEQFYLIVPILIYCFPRRRLFCIFVIAVLSAPVLRCAFPGFHTEVNTPWRSDSLLSGAALAVLVRWHPFISAVRRNRGFLVALVFMLLGGTLVMTVRPQHFGAFLHFWLAGLYTAFILMAFVGTETNALRWLSSPILVWFGQLSYGIYMFHQPIAAVVHGLIRHGPPKMRAPFDVWVTLLALCVTLVLAALSFRFFEGPILRLGHRFRYLAKPKKSYPSDDVAEAE
ncbi:MAG: acyltransferase [Chthoniobacterales bacterium]